MDWGFVLVAAPAVPADLGTAVLWDSTSNNLGTTSTTPNGALLYKRFKVAVFVNQAMTFNVQWRKAYDGTWRTINGGGSGETVSASTFFYRDEAVIGPNMRATLVAGATAPTTWETTFMLDAYGEAPGI